MDESSLYTFRRVEEPSRRQAVRSCGRHTEGSMTRYAEHGRPSARGLAVIAVAALLFMQFASATHGLDHPADTSDAVCVACVVTGIAKAPPSTVLIAAPSMLRDESPVVDCSSPILLVGDRAHRSRAPPIIS